VPKIAKKLVSQTLQSLHGVDVPKRLRDSVDQYQRHLLDLAVTLRTSGEDEAKVAKVLDTVFKSYRAELIKTIMTLRGNDG
jgi:predicted component of type VI protein secretion system